MSSVKLIAKSSVEPTFLEELIRQAEPSDREFLKKINSPEALMIYIARVSSPNQKNPSYEKLLKYCMDHGHWSVFEQVSATVEITTSLDVATQILRHRSFSFQQLSRRYSDQQVEFVKINPRRQDIKNRQNSLDDLDIPTIMWFNEEVSELNKKAEQLYREALGKGIAKECARCVLPQNTTTKLYMTGNLRSWIHYIKVRTDPSTQKEHREVASAIREELRKVFPVSISAATDVLPED